MSNLGKLLAMQKANKAGVTNAVKPSESAPRSEDAVVQHAGDDHDATQPGPVEAEAASPESAPPSSPAGGGTRIGAKFNLLRKPGAGAGVGGRTQPAIPAVRKSDPAPAADAGLDGLGGFSLDDIAGLDESSTPALTRQDAGEPERFADEIEATAPDRDLPADLTAQQLMFVEQLDNIYQILNDAELFGQSVRLIMMELQENPEYERLISDQDVHTMIRAMRNTMGLARIKKQSKTRGAKNSAAAKKSAGTKGLNASTLALLDTFGGDDDDD